MRADHENSRSGPHVTALLHAFVADEDLVGSGYEGYLVLIFAAEGARRLRGQRMISPRHGSVMDHSAESRHAWSRPHETVQALTTPAEKTP